MGRLFRVWRRLIFFFRRDKMDRELVEEMLLHLDVVVATASVSCEPWAS
jgi:hypothetical protein